MVPLLAIPTYRGRIRRRRGCTGVWCFTLAFSPVVTDWKPSRLKKDKKEGGVVVAVSRKTLPCDERTYKSIVKTENFCVGMMVCPDSKTSLIRDA